ncbi:MAG: hypothetical protein KDJ37_13125 [Hyphomicrobiaceae bacterium]|nr:hypothetical protein [Hyphomicrobiaceae bacterium]
MRFDAPPAMRVIKKEHKETQLKAFVGDQVAAQLEAAGENACARVFLLVVRSNESPVIRALASLAPELAGANISLKVVVTPAGGDTTGTWPDELSGLLDCRVILDPRLLDAHEQLWLDPTTAWIGDCMRREPAKRDAYECYAADSRETARFVRTAFMRIWEMAKPIDNPPRSNGEVSAGEQIDPHLAASAATDTPPLASTRH